jgi:4-amino-4-deoxy-L-arabinose transferase-like glycosyltransferase
VKTKSLFFIKPVWLIIIFFLIVNIIIFVTADPSAHSPCGNYGQYWLEFDLENYELTDPYNPSYPYTTMPPGFAFFLKAFLPICNVPHFDIVVIIQIVFLLIIGLVLRYLVERVLVGYGNIALIFVIFNPHSLAYANMVRYENLLALTVFGAFAGALLFVYKPRIWPAILCGFSLGLSCWIKPVTQYLVLMLPFVFPFLALVSVHKFRLFRDAGAGVLAITVAFLIILPWLLHMQKSGEGFRVHSHEIEQTALKDMVLFVEAEQLKLEGEQLRHSMMKEELSQKYSNWDELSPVQRCIIQTEYYYEYIKSNPFPMHVIVRTAVISWLRILVAGGTGEVHDLFGIKATQSNPKDSLTFKYSPESNYLAFYGLKIHCESFSVVMRILGLIGIWQLIRRREYGILSVVIGLVSFVVLAHLLAGRPRYRIPYEAPLMMLSVYGVEWIKNKFFMNIGKPIN